MRSFIADWSAMADPDPPAAATPPRPAEGRPRPLVLRLGFALGLAIVSAFLTVVLRDLIVQANFIFFFPSVIFAAWYGGFIPGAVVALLAVLTADLLFVEPVGRLVVDAAADIPFLLLFFFLAAVVSQLVNGMRAAQALAEAREREAREYAARLREQAVELEAQAAELEQQALDQEQAAEEAQLARQEAEAAYARSEVERRRVSILAETSRALTESTEYRARLHALGQLVVRELADYCLVDVITDAGSVERLVSEARAPEHAALIEELRGFPPQPGARAGPGRVVATGQPEITLQLRPRALEAVATAPRELEIMEQMAPASVIIMPLSAGARRLGAISLIRSGGGAPFDEADVELAGVMATRAGLLLEMARLYRDATEELARRRLVERELHAKADELRERSRQAEEARREAQEASAAKSQFLAVMSHELRTPLNAIMGYTDLLQSGAAQMDLSDAGRSFLDRIRVSVMHLRGLIDEILSLSRIEAGKEEVVVERVDLGALIGEVASMLQAEALLKGLRLETDLQAGVVATTDPGKVRQIVLNLASNAVKFTDRGSVSVQLRARRGIAEIQVSDTGPGIAPEHIDRVFEPFTQVDQSRTRRTGGTGLGLAVTRQLTHLLRGSITLDSTVGEGSRFVVSLPLE